jgi:holdfast attachment protein HfaA
MLFDTKHLLFASAALLGSIALQDTAQAQVFANSANYNNPVGMSASQENAPVNASLRDANGNLSVVNGQFTSSAFSQSSGVQSASASSSGVGSGGGTSGAGSMFGNATAIGNSLNVITTGSNNTVVVNATQTNNGNQNASVSLNGH